MPVRLQCSGGGEGSPGGGCRRTTRPSALVVVWGTPPPDRPTAVPNPLCCCSTASGVRLTCPVNAGQPFSNPYPRFCPQQTGPISATLVMTRPIKGPRDIQLDLEMITVNTVINFRGSSVIRLRIYVSQYPF